MLTLLHHVHTYLSVRKTPNPLLQLPNIIDLDSFSIQTINKLHSIFEITPKFENVSSLRAFPKSTTHDPFCNLIGQFDFPRMRTEYLPSNSTEISSPPNYQQNSVIEYLFRTTATTRGTNTRSSYRIERPTSRLKSHINNFAKAHLNNTTT